MTIEILKREESLGALALGLSATRARALGSRCYHGVDRRRSDRVQPSGSLFTEVRHVGRSRVVCLSLGGATFDSPARIEPGVAHRVRLKYRDLETETDIVTYRTKIQELFYAANGRSWIRYRSYAVFRERSVAVLNLLYRVIGDHWVAPVDDDTRPFPPAAS